MHILFVFMRHSINFEFIKEKKAKIIDYFVHFALFNLLCKYFLENVEKSLQSGGGGG